LALGQLLLIRSRARWGDDVCYFELDECSLAGRQNGQAITAWVGNDHLRSRWLGDRDIGLSAAAQRV
jgi:hypothetical protein